MYINQNPARRNSGNFYSLTQSRTNFHVLDRFEIEFTKFNEEIKFESVDFFKKSSVQEIQFKAKANFKFPIKKISDENSRMRFDFSKLIPPLTI